MRRFCAWLLPVFLTMGLVIGMPVAGSGVAQAAPPVKIRVSPTSPVKGESFAVSGKLPSLAARPVTLQVRSGKKWKTLTRSTTSPSGAFALSGSTRKSSLKVRVVAKALRIDGVRYPKITTRTLKVLTVGQSVGVSLPKLAYVNGAVSAKFTVSPARPGRPVKLQVKRGAKWVTVAVGVEGKDGSASLPFTPTAMGEFSYRGVVAASNGAPSKVSKTVKINVKKVPPPRITTSSLPSATTGTAYDQALRVEGNRAGAWTIANGVLPVGLALSAGHIVGKASRPGTAAFTVRFTDRAGLSATQALTIRVTGSATSTTVTVPVTPSQPVSVQVTPEMRVDVPSGTATTKTNLTYTPDPGGAESLAAGEVLRVQAFGDLTLGSGQPARPLTLTWTFTAPLPQGSGASFFTGDPTSHDFKLLETRISADRRTATATADHLSGKGFLDWVGDEAARFAGELLSTRGDRPTCQGDVPAWVTDTIFIDKDKTGDNPLLACVGHDPNHPDLFVAKFTNNRGYGLALDVPAEWTWIYFTDLEGLSDNLVHVMQLLQPADGAKGTTRIMLAPGQEVDFGFSHANLSGNNDYTIQGHLDATAVANGLIMKAIESSVGKMGARSTVLAAAAVANCLPGSWEKADAAQLIRTVYEKGSCLTNLDALKGLVTGAFGPEKAEDWKIFDDKNIANQAIGRINTYIAVFQAAQLTLELGTGVMLPPAAVAMDISVDNNPHPSISVLPSGTEGQPYTVTLTATGGTPPYTWTATGLPAGLTLASNGELTGTPTLPGAYTPSFKVTDKTGLASRKTIPIAIQNQHGSFPIVGSPRPGAFVRDFEGEWASFGEFEGYEHGLQLTSTGGIRLSCVYDYVTQMRIQREVGRDGQSSRRDGCPETVDDIYGRSYVSDRDANVSGPSGGTTAYDASRQVIWRNNDVVQVFPTSDGGTYPAQIGAGGRIAMVDPNTGRLQTPIVTAGTGRPKWMIASGDVVSIISGNRGGVTWVRRSTGDVLRGMPCCSTANSAPSLGSSVVLTRELAACTLGVSREDETGVIWTTRLQLDTSAICQSKAVPIGDGGAYVVMQSSSSDVPTRLWRISPDGIATDQGTLSSDFGFLWLTADLAGRLAYAQRTVVRCTDDPPNPRRECAYFDVRVRELDGHETQVAQITMTEAGSSLSSDIALGFGVGQLWMVSSQYEASTATHGRLFVGSVPLDTPGDLRTTRRFQN